jgi:hypothetical protein
MANNITAAFDKLMSFPAKAQRAIMILVRDLALATVEELNTASDINTNASDDLVVLTLSSNHWNIKKMPNGDICDVLASAQTEDGIGVYSLKNLPVQMNPSGINANIHENCNCTLVPLKQYAEENSWKVVISNKGVEFINESQSVTDKVHGTALGVQKVKEGTFKVTREGKNPSDFADVIINKFLTELKNSVETLLPILFKNI